MNYNYEKLKVNQSIRNGNIKLMKKKLWKIYLIFLVNITISDRIEIEIKKSIEKKLKVTNNLINFYKFIWQTNKKKTNEKLFYSGIEKKIQTNLSWTKKT